METPSASAGATTEGRDSTSNTSTYSAETPGGVGGPHDFLTVHLSGTREGVDEARRRLEVAVRTVEVSVQAPPQLAAALRANGLALALRIQEEFCVRMFIGGGGGMGDYALGPGANDGGGGGRGYHDNSAVAAAAAYYAGGSGEAQAMVGWATVHMSGLPEDVSAARDYILRLDCLCLVISVERRALPTIIGTAGANVRQFEVCGF